MGKMWHANWKTEFYVIALSAKSIASSTEMHSMFKVKNVWHFGIKNISLLENTEKTSLLYFGSHHLVSSGKQERKTILVFKKQTKPWFTLTLQILVLFPLTTVGKGCPGVTPQPFIK